MMQLTILSSPDQITEHGTTFSVSHLLWGTKHAPAVTGSIGYVQEDGFYVEMICEESDPLRRYGAVRSGIPGQRDGGFLPLSVCRKKKIGAFALPQPGI